MAESPGIEPSGEQADASLDFDGDGHDDAAVAFSPSCGSGGCDWWLFVREGPCARFVGQLFGRKVMPLRRDAAGHLMLKVEAYGGSAQWTESHARLDAGGKYAVYEERDCKAASDRPGTICGPWASSHPRKP